MHALRKISGPMHRTALLPGKWAVSQGDERERKELSLLGKSRNMKCFANSTLRVLAATAVTRDLGRLPPLRSRFGRSIVSKWRISLSAPVVVAGCSRVRARAVVGKRDRYSSPCFPEMMSIS